MGAAEEGTSMIDENKNRPDCQNKVMGLILLLGGERNFNRVRSYTNHCKQCQATMGNDL